MDEGNLSFVIGVSILGTMVNYVMFKLAKMEMTSSGTICSIVGWGSMAIYLYRFLPH